MPLYRERGSVGDERKLPLREEALHQNAALPLPLTATSGVRH